MFDIDSESICRDDDCIIVEMHHRHRVVATPQPHSRADLTVTPPWKRDDPDALAEAVVRACSEAYPKHFSAIARDVRDDYGACTDRTVYRYLRKVIDRGLLIKLDLGLAFAAYIRPKSRLLNDLDSLRDYMLGVVEMHPCTRTALNE